MLTSSIGIGLFVSLLFTEITGLLTGGLISSGYLALFVYQPARIISTLCAALATAVLVTLYSRFIVVFGRRRFAFCVLTGYILSFASALLIPTVLDLTVDMRTVGYVIPGLIAHDILRQGLQQTLLALGVATFLTRLLLEFFSFLGLF